MNFWSCFLSPAGSKPPDSLLNFIVKYFEYLKLLTKAPGTQDTTFPSELPEIGFWTWSIISMKISVCFPKDGVLRWHETITKDRGWRWAHCHLALSTHLHSANCPSKPQWKDLIQTHSCLLILTLRGNSVWNSSSPILDSRGHGAGHLVFLHDCVLSLWEKEPSQQCSQDAWRTLLWLMASAVSITEALCFVPLIWSESV